MHKIIENRSQIIEYYKEMDSEAVFIESILDIWKIFYGFKKKNVIVSQSKYIRGIASLLKMRRANIVKVQLLA